MNSMTKKPKILDIGFEYDYKKIWELDLLKVRKIPNSMVDLIKK